MTEERHFSSADEVFRTYIHEYEPMPAPVQIETEHLSEDLLENFRQKIREIVKTLDVKAAMVNGVKSA